MAKHDISLEIPHGITVVNKDIEVTVREDGRILGRVGSARARSIGSPRIVNA